MLKQQHYTKQVENEKKKHKEELNPLDKKTNSSDKTEACYSDSLRRQNTSKRQVFFQGSEYSGRHLPASICHPQGILVL